MLVVFAGDVEMVGQHKSEQTAFWFVSVCPLVEAEHFVCSG